MLEAALLAAGLMILTRCTDSRTARRSPDWQVLVVIATSFGIGAALEKTGAASFMAGGLIGLADGDPWITLALVFVGHRPPHLARDQQRGGGAGLPDRLQAAQAWASRPSPSF
jgi:hypothetical protein